MNANTSKCEVMRQYWKGNNLSWMSKGRLHRIRLVELGVIGLLGVYSDRERDFIIYSLKSGKTLKIGKQHD
jgi:hypothetical protein